MTGLWIVAARRVVRVALAKLVGSSATVVTLGTAPTIITVRLAMTIIARIASGTLAPLVRVVTKLSGVTILDITNLRVAAIVTSVCLEAKISIIPVSVTVTVVPPVSVLSVVSASSWKLTNVTVMTILTVV
jgi:hypothetical protein